MNTVCQDRSPLVVSLLLLGLSMGFFLSALAQSAFLFLPGAGSGLLVTSVIIYVLGYWLNKVQPVQQVDADAVQLREHLWDMVRRSEFRVAPGSPGPATEAEAREQVTYVVAQYRAQELRRLLNRHVALSRPVQVWGALGAGTGMVLSAVGIAIMLESG